MINRSELVKILSGKVNSINFIINSDWNISINVPALKIKNQSSPEQSLGLKINELEKQIAEGKKNNVGDRKWAIVVTWGHPGVQAILRGG